MWLVDTSVWIAIFRREDPLDLTRYIAFDEVVTCLPVIQEVLQGFRDERSYRIARDSMRSLPVIDDPLGFDVFDAAVDLYRAARRIGVTVRSSVDCLIAASAIRHDLGVLHHDRDYAQLAKVSGLRQRALRA
ncbi:MAG TPA: PIN domain-containing protein [Polyangiales bacterium]|nr:PIN domain-containing protein [Polyangiales bacterium]